MADGAPRAVDPVREEQMEILRRITDRGKEYCLSRADTQGLDPWQHLQDGLQRIGSESKD